MDVAMTLHLVECTVLRFNVLEIAQLLEIGLEMRCAQMTFK
jgi:hypothetical protein